MDAQKSPSFCHRWNVFRLICTVSGTPRPTVQSCKSPDRVYAWAVNGHDELSAYLRIKAGKSRAGRGVYKRAMPFFTLRFDSLDSALGILLGLDDMLDSAKKGKLIMEGAPEFGAQIGEYMLTVAGFIQ